MPCRRAGVVVARPPVPAFWPLPYAFSQSRSCTVDADLSSSTYPRVQSTSTSHCCSRPETKTHQDKRRKAVHTFLWRTSTPALARKRARFSPAIFLGLMRMPRATCLEEDVLPCRPRVGLCALRALCALPVTDALGVWVFGDREPPERGQAHMRRAATPIFSYA